VKVVDAVGDASGLFERRVKVLLPMVGKRLGGSTQAVMQAARDGAVEFLSGGAVRIAGVDLAADEIEVQAVPREGQHVAEDDGLVVELDISFTPELITEGDARELMRAVQEARKGAGLQREDRIELHLVGAPAVLSAHTAAISTTVGAQEIHLAKADPVGDEWQRSSVTLSSGEATLSIRRVAG